MPNGPPQRRMEAAVSWPCQPAGYGTAGNGGLVMTPYHPVFIQKYAIRTIILIITIGSGYRRMTRSFQQGQLDLIGSVIGLSECKR